MGLIGWGGVRPVRRLLVAIFMVVLAVCSCAGSSRGYAILDAVRVSQDGTRLTLVGLHGACDEVLPVRVIETPREVRVTVPLEVQDGPCTSLGLSLEVAVKLDAPLGQRSVIEDQTDEPLPRLGR